MLKSLVIFLMFSGLFSQNAHAADREKVLRPGRGNSGIRGNERSERVSNLKTGELNYGGSGCPAGSMRAVFAPDNLSFTLLYDNFVAEIDQTRGHRDVMSCDAIIPIELPQGMQMEITRVDFRGFAGLPDRAQGALHSVFNFLGTGGRNGDRINLRYQFKGPMMDNYELSSDTNPTAISETSQCGGKVYLKIMTELQLRARGGPNSETASITLDSIDGSSNAVYFVNWRSCSPSPGRFR